MTCSISPYEKYLYVTSHLFLIPIFLSIYMEKYDKLWISTSILITSLLRWGNPDKIIYQYIDHNWVKIIFLIAFLSGVDIFMSMNTNEVYILLYFGSISSILFFWLTEFIFMVINPKIIVPLHMYVHFYSIITILILFHIDYNINEIIYKFKDFLLEFM